MTRASPADYPPVDGTRPMRDAELVASRALLGVDTMLGWLRHAQRALLLAARGRRPPAGARYVDVRDRVWASDLSVSRQLRDAIQASKKNLAGNELPPMHWKGVVHMKDPFSVAAYPLVIQEVRPRTVIEIGAYHGGSALWIADMLGVFGLDATHVYAFDHDLSRIRVDDPRITFLQADSNRPAEFPADLLAALPHPWLLIEDAHVNVHALLEHFDRFLLPEDYVIVEDTLWPEFYADLKRFLLERGGEYLVDSRYCDLFGYNGTWHLNGYIRKVGRPP